MPAISFNASSIRDFTRSTEEVTHLNIKIGLSSDRSNVALAEPGTILKDLPSCVGMNMAAVRHMQQEYKTEKRIKDFLYV